MSPAATGVPEVSPAAAFSDPASYRSLLHPPGTRWIDVIDQRALPHSCPILRLDSLETTARAIGEMWVRGAPLIGAVGAFGLALALDANPDDAHLARAHALLDATRPTAVNLRWALDRIRCVVEGLPLDSRADAAWSEADAIAAEDLEICHAIGRAGLALLRAIAAARPGPVRVMTHCNAGALATCGWGTATAPIFLARLEGIPLHVYVSETRPRLQGANLTAWEMRQRGVDHSLFVDGASGLLMRKGLVDVVFVGADRVAANGDVCNKIGTYDKALAAQDNGVPFYAAVPSPTIDWSTATGDAIPIEVRGDDEVLVITGRNADEGLTSVRIATLGTPALNYAFDVTPSRLVTGLVTERGTVPATPDALGALFPDRLGRT